MVTGLQTLLRMMSALDYLEAHMAGDLDVGEAANIACSSPFHFQRMFHMLTGVTVAEYIRKRRLTLAAQELASTKARVIDVALKYEIRLRHAGGVLQGLPARP